MPEPDANSYSSKLAEQAQSKKLTAKELEEQAQREKAASAQGASVWNQAGTFEERDRTAFAKEQLTGLLVGLEHHTASGCFCLTKLTSTEGEATVWVVRGNRRAGFDFTIEAAWSIASEDSQSTATGSMKLPSITPDDLDELADLMEVTVAEPAGLQEPDVRKLVRGSSSIVAERLSKLHQLLKEL